MQAEFDEAKLPAGIGDVKSLREKGNAAPQISINTVKEVGRPREVSTARTVADKMLQFAQPDQS